MKLRLPQAGRLCFLAVLIFSGLNLFAQAPPNDDCANAITLVAGVNQTESTVSATENSPVGLPACGGADLTGVNWAGVWYTFVGNGGDATLSTDNPSTNFDTEIMVYTGSCGAFTCVGGDDDGGSGLTSRLTFTTTPGTTYLVFVDGNTGDKGTFVLSFGLEDCVNAPVVACPEFTASFEGCPNSLGPNTPGGSWSALPADGMYQSTVGGSFTTTIDLSTCITDDCSALNEIEVTLGRAFEENRNGDSVTLVNVLIFRDAQLNVAPDSVFVRVTISDITPPVITSCRDTTILLDDSGMASLDLNILIAGTDNCGSVNGANETVSFDCNQIFNGGGDDGPSNGDGPFIGVSDGLGERSYTLVIEDGSENLATCDVTVTVEDQVPPMLECQEVTYYLPAEDEAPISFSRVAGTSYIDITGSSTPLNVISGCDDCTEIVNLGLDFPFFGQSYNEARISSNGLLTFDLRGC
jgi:hypothetical protein